MEVGDMDRQAYRWRNHWSERATGRIWPARWCLRGVNYLGRSACTCIREQHATRRSFCDGYINSVRRQYGQQKPVMLYNSNVSQPFDLTNAHVKSRHVELKVLGETQI